MIISICVYPEWAENEERLLVVCALKKHERGFQEVNGGETQIDTQLNSHRKGAYAQKTFVPDCLRIFFFM